MIQLSQPHGATRVVPRSAVPQKSVKSTDKPDVKFGSMPFANLLQVAVDPKDQQQGERRRKKGRFMKLAGATGALTLMMVGVYPASGLFRQIDNRVNGQPLESVLMAETPETQGKKAAANLVPDKPADEFIPGTSGGNPVLIPPTAQAPAAADPEAPKMTTRELIEFLQHNHRLNIPAPMLPEMAEAGLVQEVLITNPLTKEAIVILINGKEMPTKLDDTTQKRLIEEFQVPVNKPFLFWMNISPLEATLLSALIAGSITQLLTRDDKVFGKLTDEDKQRIQVNDLGRYIVAKKLDTSIEPITMADVEAQLKTPWLSEEQKPLTREQLKKQLAVLWAGYFAEAKFYGDNVSLSADGIAARVNEIVRFAVVKLDMAKVFGDYRPAELSDDEKAKVAEEAKKLVAEAAKLSKETIDSYEDDNIKMLMEGRSRFTRHQMSDKEITSILENGKTVNQVRAERHKQMVHTTLQRMGNWPVIRSFKRS